MSLGPWIQPADMWVYRDVTVGISQSTQRNLQWDEDAGTYESNWEAVIEYPTGTFEGMLGSGGVTVAEEIIADDVTYPFSGFQNLTYNTHQSFLAFVEIAADTSTDDGPQYDPDPEPGVSVEYESELGEYHDLYAYDIPFDHEGTYDPDDPLNMLPSLFVYANSYDVYINGDATVDPPISEANFGLHPIELGGWLNTFDNYGQITAPFVTKGITVTSPVIIATAAFPTQHLVTPHPTGADGGIYFGRWNVSTPIDYVVARRYTPPRYRLIYPGTGGTLRQRQTAPGNTGGGPSLRARNHGGYTGGPPLRNRQTGL